MSGFAFEDSDRHELINHMFLTNPDMDEEYRAELINEKRIYEALKEGDEKRWSKEDEDRLKEPDRQLRKNGRRRGWLAERMIFEDEVGEHIDLEEEAGLLEEYQVLL